MKQKGETTLHYNIDEFKAANEEGKINDINNSERSTVEGRKNTSNKPNDTKRAIVSAHYFANCINNYQNNMNNKCPFIKNDADNIDLLKYIYIRGGALRDIILDRDINDIDVVINVLKITKLHLKHLKKYHSTIKQQSINCSCYLWQRYLKMYNYNILPEYQNNEIDIVRKLEVDMIRCDFLINAKFIKQIIVNSSPSTQAINTWGYTNWIVNINKSLIYNNIDLNGAKFDISDEMSYAQGIIESTDNNVKQVAHTDQKIFKDNMDYFDISNNKNNALFSNYNISRTGNIGKKLMKLNLPNYSFSMKYSTQLCDFSINGIRIPLYMIYTINCNRNDIKNQWYSKILQYTNSMDNGIDIIYKKHNKQSINDIKNKIICQRDLYTLSMDYLYEDYFWRFIKILCKFHDELHNKIWTIDNNTLALMGKAVKLYFMDFNNIQRQEFINRFSTWAIKPNLNINEYKSVIIKRLNIFKFIKIHKHINNAFNKYASFKNELINTINKKLGKCGSNIIDEILGNNNYNIEILEGNNTLSKSAKRRSRRKKKKITPIIDRKYCVHCGKNGHETILCPLIKGNTDEGEGINKKQITKGSVATRKKYTNFMDYFRKENKSKIIKTSIACYCRETCRNNKDTLRNYLMKYGLFNKNEILDIYFMEKESKYSKRYDLGNGNYTFRAVITYYSIVRIQPVNGLTDIKNKICNLNLGGVNRMALLDSKAAKTWKGKANNKLYITKFDIKNETFGEFKKLFKTFGELEIDIKFGLDKKYNDPYAIVTYKDIKDAKKLWYMHNKTNKYLTIGNYVPNIDYSLDYSNYYNY